MSKCVTLIASAKIPNGKRCSSLKIQAPLRNKNEQKNAFCLPLIVHEKFTISELQSK